MGILNYGNESSEEERLSLHFPINIVDRQVFISPEEIVKSSIREYRSGRMSDKQLATHICELLSLIMERNHLIISHENVKNVDGLDRFRILTFDKAKD
jgi:hypothetical protein